MDKLNVCLINDSFPPAIDGVANAVTNYAAIITREHGSASVVTPFYPEADDSVFDFPVLRYPSIDMTKAVGYRAGMPFAPEIMNRLETANFDIIHTHCPITSTMFARSLRDRINKPVVFTYHTKFDIDIANAVHSKLLQEQAARLLVQNISACDEVWTVSHGAGENLRHLGYQGDYIVMPNGVDFPQGRVSDELINSVSAPFDLPEGLPVFLFVGRMMWYKGIRIILDALKKLSEDAVSYRMVFVGGGNDKQEIMKYSSALGLDGQVFFAEPIHDRELVRAWYCRADLFLFPSTFDTNGLVVREAAACGLASVLVAGSCAAEDIEDGKNGFLIEENAESMAAVLEKLCAERETIARVGEGAQRDIYVSWEDAVSSACERYQVVIDRYAGSLHIYDRLSDDFFHSMAEISDMFSRQRSMQASFRAGLLDTQESILEELNDMQELFVSELIEARDSIKEGISGSRQKLRRSINEIAEYIERFM